MDLKKYVVYYWPISGQASSGYPANSPAIEASSKEHAMHLFWNLSEAKNCREINYVDTL